MRIQKDNLLTIYCLTYNHEKYLKKTLDGFVNQKVDFKYKVIVHDDASTDRTQKIMKEYEQRYPSLFLMIYQTQNQYSKGVKIKKEIIEPLVDSKYVACCEGDDYWCDSGKLQMQIDYMESHPDCSLCVHDTLQINEAGESLGRLFNGKKSDTDYYMKDILKAGGGGLFQLSSYLGKRDVLLNVPDELSIKGIGDLPMAIHACYKGYIHYIGRVMSCYRVGVPTSWSITNDSGEKRIVHGHNLLEGIDRIDSYTGKKYGKVIDIAKGEALVILYRYEYGWKKLVKNREDQIKIARWLLYKIPYSLKKRYRRLLTKIRREKYGDL